MTRIEFLSSRFHYSFGPHLPTLTIQPGTSLSVICPDCDNTFSDGTELNADQRSANDQTNPLQGNPLAGPICVEGAEPGDLLAVTIDSVQLDRNSGITLLAPNHGVVPRELLVATGGANQEFASVPRRMYHWQIDNSAGTATLANPLGSVDVCIPLNPFVGCIGVCPPDAQFVSSLHSGSFGGNLDLPIVRSGATIFLPVNHDGALLMLGDLHAAQGHGEIIGGGVETSGRVDCTIRLMKRASTGVCMLWDSQILSAIAVKDDLRKSVQYACAGLVNWLAQYEVVDQFDLYNLVSQTVTFIIGNLNKPPYPVAASIRLAVLPTPLLEAMERRKE